MKKMSETELEIMKVLWDSHPQKAIQIIQQIKLSKTWSDKTIRTLIDRCVGKEVVGIDKSQKEYQFYPLMTRSECEKEMQLELSNKLYDGSIKNMIASYFMEGNLSKEDIKEIKQMIEELEKDG